MFIQEWQAQPKEQAASAQKPRILASEYCPPISAVAVAHELFSMSVAFIFSLFV